MENRRDFFKAVGLFAAGVVGAKIASYTPKKKQEELQVAESIAVFDKEGNEYNMVVVPKKEEPKKVMTPSSSSFSPNHMTVSTQHGMTIRGTEPMETKLVINQNKELRKLNS